jgi:hypothetical protein
MVDYNSNEMGLLATLKNYKAHINETVNRYKSISETMNDKTITEKMDEDIYKGYYSYEQFVNEKYTKAPDVDAIDIITDDYIIVSDKIKYINKINKHENKINLIEKRIETQNICIGALTILSCYLLYKK